MTTSTTLFSSGPHDIPDLMNELIPTTPRRNGRYDKSVRPPVYEAVSEWLSFTHPEGAKYFYRARGKHISTVTDADIYNSAVLAKVNAWTEQIERALCDKPIVVSSPSIELFLEPADDLSICRYYLVDHATRSEFWIDEITSELLDFGQVASTSHLKTALEVQYWDHVQYYPMHTTIPPRSLDELLGVLCHGLTDRITSSTSTFGYSVDECEKFIKVIKLARKQPFDGHLTWTAARIWYNIVYCRFYQYYGEDMVRLNRNQNLFPAADEADHKALKVADLLCFGLPGKQLARFEDIYIDQRVERDDFRKLLAHSLGDWKEALLLSLPLLAANMLLSFASSPCPALWLASLVLCATATLLSTILTTKFRGMRNAVAEEGYYTMYTLRSETYGFKPAALVFSLPRALAIWGLGLVLLQGIVLMRRMVGTGAAIGCVALVLLVLLCTAQVLSEDDKTSPLARLSSPLSSFLGLFKREIQSSTDEKHEAESMV
ncbi:hypothetical protein HWV62_21798 [Athelia sp. TMB]|nr:hypothetical protein HWV62_21798 [Athelia sp. TMB]